MTALHYWEKKNIGTCLIIVTMSYDKIDYVQFQQKCKIIIFKENCLVSHPQLCIRRWGANLGFDYVKFVMLLLWDGEEYNRYINLNPIIFLKIYILLKADLILRVKINSSSIVLITTNFRLNLTWIILFWIFYEKKTK